MELFDLNQLFSFWVLDHAGSRELCLALGAAKQLELVKVPLTRKGNKEIGGHSQGGTEGRTRQIRKWVPESANRSGVFASHRD